MNVISRHRSRSTRIWLGAVFACLLIAGLVLSIFFSRSNALFRQSVVVATDPVTVWSWNKKNNTFTVVVISPDAVVDGSYGVGKYSLRALWQLGLLDSGHRTLLSESMEDMLGLPIATYFGGKSEPIEVSDVIAHGKEIFSLPGVLAIMRGDVFTNLPVVDAFAWGRALYAARGDAIDVVDLRERLVYDVEELPDGTTRNVLDPDLVDRALGVRFEDEQIRDEGLTVGIYNTTPAAAIGTKVGRVLGHLGLRIVSVGNDPTLLTRCRIDVAPGHRRSLAVDLIQKLYGCGIRETEETGTTDIVLRLGSDQAKKYSPPARY